MKHKRRQFLKFTGLTGIGFASGGWVKAFSSETEMHQHMESSSSDVLAQNSWNETGQYADPVSIIGQYGAWAAGLTGKELPSYSFRRKEWPHLDQWRKAARQKAMDRMSIPSIGGMPQVTVNKVFEYDGLHIEELNWQLPYGRPTEAVLLKPADAKGPLPGILAFHDHGGNKYFGTRKIIRTSDNPHPMMIDHQKEYYEGRAWANEIAKRGYTVLVPDAFPFASRRVMMEDIPPELRRGLTDNDPENPENIRKYNEWAGEHEHIMAKSLFSAGTTWPGVFFAEDRKALDILCARKDVNPKRVGCAGLSGGGMRTVFMGGLDPRIRCAITVGFMTTWRDFLLNKAVNHTWMTYVPLLPKELDFPEILGLRAPLPAFVLNDVHDDLYTMIGMKEAEGILIDVYKKAGAAEQFRSTFYPGPHKFDKRMQEEAFDWFDRWLKA